MQTLEPRTIHLKDYAPCLFRIPEVALDFRLDPMATRVTATMKVERANAEFVREQTGYLADPHTAIGIAAGRALPAGHGVPMVALATAHPAKFPDAIEQALVKNGIAAKSIRQVFYVELACNSSIKFI
jgi:threonine synthase